MTQPTITYGQGFLDDCNDDSTWSADHAHEDGQTATMSVLADDIFDINVTVSGGNKVCYYEYDMTNISSTIYNYFLTRYKTSSTSIKAKAVLEFNDASTQTVLDESSSTTWTTATATPTSAKTIDKIRLYANQATGNVYYDFALIAKNYTIPFISNIAELELNNTYGFLGGVNRQGQIPQYLGAESPIIHLSGTMDTAGTWTSTYSQYGEFLMRIWAQACTEKWQWFTSDLINCKVVPLTLRIVQDSKSAVPCTWDMTLKKFDMSSGSNSNWSWNDYFGWTA